MGGAAELDWRGYESFLVERCTQAFEMRYWDGERLAAVALVDRGARSLSAVYCLWDPDYGKLSLGTYSVLKQVQLCRRVGAAHLYLGLYVADNRHMAYKGRFRANERLIGGRWRRFD